MADPLADQERAAAREAGHQAAIYWQALRTRKVPRLVAARLTLAWVTGEDRSGIYTDRDL